MDSIGFNHMLEVIEGQLLIAQESQCDDAIMVLKVVEDEFRRTFGYLE